ncbi:hypothetical protein HY212_07280 [Candidatus Pacearchaeota archaeon]|nr:hypothetical protein [Candidatus Pacearchaeota archaeon]
MTNIINPQNPHERYPYEQIGQQFRMFCPIDGRETWHRYEGQMADEPDRFGLSLGQYRTRGLFTCNEECKSTTSIGNRTRAQDNEIQEARVAA